jgi:hypothetical protein
MKIMISVAMLNMFARTFPLGFEVGVFDFEQIALAGGKSSAPKAKQESSETSVEKLPGNQVHDEDFIPERYDLERPEGMSDEEYYEYYYKEKLLFTDESGQISENP